MVVGYEDEGEGDVSGTMGEGGRGAEVVGVRGALMEEGRGGIARRYLVGGVGE